LHYHIVDTNITKNYKFITTLIFNTLSNTPSILQ
jgi:hypothetical protein